MLNRIRERTIPIAIGSDATNAKYNSEWRVQK